MTTWKTENFGTGTYNNTGELIIGDNCNIDMTSTSMKFTSGRQNDTVVYSIRLNASNTVYLVDFYGRSCIDVSIGILGAVNGSAFIKPKGNSLKLHYVIIGANGVKSGEIPANSTSLVTVTNVGPTSSPFMCITNSYQ